VLALHDCISAGQSTPDIRLIMTGPRTLVVAMFGISAGLGVLQAYVQNHGQDLRVISIVSAIAFAPLLFAWCKADAVSRKISAPPAAALLVGFVAVFGIPYYFLKSKSLGRALGSIAAAVGLYALMLIVGGIVAWGTSRYFAI
jgi:hypothetical protein